MGLIHCPYCGVELPDHARYCDACGHRLTVEDRTMPPNRQIIVEDNSGSTRDSHNRFITFILENSAAVVLGIVVYWGDGNGGFLGYLSWS